MELPKKRSKKLAGMTKYNSGTKANITNRNNPPRKNPNAPAERLSNLFSTGGSIRFFTRDIIIVDKSCRARNISMKLIKLIMVLATV